MNTVEKLQKFFEKTDNIIFGYLFGSYDNNTQTKNSDIDIAVYLKDKSLDNILQLNYELSKLLKKDVDLLVLNTTRNIYLLNDILTNSTLLKDDEKRFDYEIKTQHDILDFKHFRKIIDVA